MWGDVLVYKDISKSAMGKRPIGHSNRLFNVHFMIIFLLVLVKRFRVIMT